MKRIDMTGRKFGRWTVIRVDEVKKPLKWVCICDCGTVKSICAKSLRNGFSRSCGCYSKEVASIKAKKHGFSASGAYVSWMNMMSRCEKIGSISYHNYGARGIVVCDRWRKFENFLEDMGHRPSGLQLDRIDSNGNYELSNCRWVSPSENSRNRRNSVFITHKGETRHIKEWAEVLGVKPGTLQSRFYRSKGAIDQIFK